MNFTCNGLCGRITDIRVCIIPIGNSHTGRLVVCRILNGWQAIDGCYHSVQIIDLSVDWQATYGHLHFLINPLSLSVGWDTCVPVARCILGCGSTLGGFVVWDLMPGVTLVVVQRQGVHCTFL